MTQPSESILPQEPSVSLLTSANLLPEELRPFDKWSQGLKARNIACVQAGSEAAICPDPPVERDPYSADLTCSEFFPLVTYVTHGADGFIGDDLRWAEEADQTLRARLAFAVARELWTGTITGSASLQSEATVSSSADLTPLAGIEAALSDFEEFTQGGVKPTILVPSALYGNLSTQGFWERKGGKLLTDLDHVVIPGPGFPNEPGTWGPAGASAGAGKVWVYVTGPIEVSEPHFIARPDREQIQRKNLLEVTPQVWTIARFDTCAVFASRVTLPV